MDGWRDKFLCHRGKCNIVVEMGLVISGEGCSFLEGLGSGARTVDRPTGGFVLLQRC